MKIKIRTMQMINKNTSQIIPHFINTDKPLLEIDKKLRKILKNARVDEYSDFKKIVTGTAKWHESAYNCIFVDEREAGNIYHFGCFSATHPFRYLIGKSYKTLRGAIKYLPQFLLDFPAE